MEKEIIKDSSRDSNEFVCIVHLIIIEEKCIHGPTLLCQICVVTAKPQAQDRDAALQQVQGDTLNVSSTLVGSLAIDESSKLSRFGCMDVSLNSITVTGNVSIA